MAIARADETDLLLPLYDGVHDVPPWNVFLRRLRQRVRADGATLTVRGGTGGERWFGDADADDDAVWRGRLRPGRVYSAEPGPRRVVRVDEPGGSSGWLTIARHQRDFSAADGALLGGLAPHLAGALRTWAVLTRERLAGDMAEAALRRAGVGWIAFAADGRVIAHSDAAAAAARLAGSRDVMKPGLVMLRDTPPTWMLLVPGIERVAAIGLVDVARAGDPAARAAVLAGLFGLAPSEARLAAALADGATIAEAAAALGLTVETARNYSKRVFAKSRTHGQPDLIRAIAASVARFT